MENNGKGLSGMNRMGMIIVGSMFLTFTLFTSASSRPYRLGKLPDKGKNFGCSTCHINPNGGGPLNTFGEDYRKMAMPNGDQYTDELGKMDSDGDSYNNSKEFSFGTRPGDARSKPAQ